MRRHPYKWFKNNFKNLTFISYDLICPIFLFNLFFNLSISIFPNQPRNLTFISYFIFSPLPFTPPLLKLFFFWKPNNSSRLSREEWFEIESKFKNSACKEDGKHNTTENKFCCHAPYWTQVERCTFPRQK